MVETINNHRTWIVAELSNENTPHVSLINGIYYTVLSKSIILKVFRPKNGYKKTQKWIIPEIVLEKTARRIKRENKDFWRHYKRGRFTLEDIELLVKMSTYNIVDLELDEYEF